MTITLTDEQLAGLSYGTAQRNAANPDAAPMTDEEFATDVIGVQCDVFSAAKSSAERAALASNDRLMALGIAVAAQPDKMDEIEAATIAILSKP